MDQILDLPVADERQLTFAPFGFRVLALAVDTILAVILVAVVSLFLDQNTDTESRIILIYLVADFLYFSLMESSDKQGTLGKMIFRIKVGNQNGSRISFGNAAGRYLGRFLSRLFLGIGYFMAAWDRKSQTLHDKLADTYVFKE